MPAKSLAGEERHTWMVAIGGCVYDVHGGGDDDEHNWRQYDINDDRKCLKICHYLAPSSECDLPHRRWRLPSTQEHVGRALKDKFTSVLLFDWKPTLGLRGLLLTNAPQKKLQWPRRELVWVILPNFFPPLLKWFLIIFKAISASISIIIIIHNTLLGLGSIDSGWWFGNKNQLNDRFLSSSTISFKCPTMKHNQESTCDAQPLCTDLHHPLDGPGFFLWYQMLWFKHPQQHQKGRHTRYLWYLWSLILESTWRHGKAFRVFSGPPLAFTLRKCKMYENPSPTVT